MKKKQQPDITSAAIKALKKHQAKPPKKMVDVPGSRKLARVLEGYNDILGDITRVAVDIAFKRAIKALQAESRRIARQR